MKKLILISIVLLLVAASHGLAQGPVGPGGSSLSDEQEKPPTMPTAMPGSPGTQGDVLPRDIFFADGTTSPDGKYLYVVLDRFLYQYSLPSLVLVKKTELAINTAPVTPSISISKDSKHIYIISNGMLYQIDGVTLKILTQKKLMP
jgi:hypothetical protein